MSTLLSPAYSRSPSPPAYNDDFSAYLNPFLSPSLLIEKESISDAPILTDSPTTTDAMPLPIPSQASSASGHMPFSASPDQKKAFATSPRRSPARPPQPLDGRADFLAAPRSEPRRSRSKSDPAFPFIRGASGLVPAQDGAQGQDPSMEATQAWTAEPQQSAPTHTSPYQQHAALPSQSNAPRRSPSPSPARRSRAPGPYELGLQPPVTDDDEFDSSAEGGTRRRARSAGRGHRLSRSDDFGASAGVGQAAGGLPPLNLGQGGAPSADGHLFANVYDQCSPSPQQQQQQQQQQQHFPVVSMAGSVPMDPNMVHAWAAYQAAFAQQQAAAYMGQPQPSPVPWGYGQPVQYAGAPQSGYTAYQIGPDGVPVFYPVQAPAGVPGAMMNSPAAPYLNAGGPSPPPPFPAGSPAGSGASPGYVYHSPRPANGPSPGPSRQGSTGNSSIQSLSRSNSHASSGEGGVRSRTTAATIEAAQRRRKEGAQAKFICDLCGESFTRRYNLRGHQRAHRNEKPYACSFEGCEKAFARAHDCKRHELLHLSVKRYHCEPCNREFVRLDALQRHHRSEVGQTCVQQLVQAGYEIGYDTSLVAGGVQL